MKNFILLFISLFIFSTITPLHTNIYASNGQHLAEAPNPIFYSYDNIVQAARSQKKTYFLVLFNPDQSEFFASLHDVAELWASSQKDIDILLLCPTGINILIYPPQPDPMLAKIEDFQSKFAPTLPTSGTWCLIIKVDADQESIYDMYEFSTPFLEALSENSYHAYKEIHEWLSNIN